MTLYQAQPDRSLRAKALAKEYGIGGHSHDYLDGSRGFVNHDWKGLEFERYPDHQKITLKWAQVEKYIDLMVQSDRYLTDREKEHYTPPSPVSAKPDADLTHAKNLIREFCQKEYDSEPDFSNLSKIGNSDDMYVHKFDNFIWYDASSDFERVDDTTFTISTSASGILGIDYIYESGDNKADIYVDGELFESPTVTFDYDFSQRHILVVSDDCTVKNEIKVVFNTKEQADGFKGMCFSWE